METDVAGEQAQVVDVDTRLPAVEAVLCHRLKPIWEMVCETGRPLYSAVVVSSVHHPSVLIAELRRCSEVARAPIGLAEWRLDGDRDDWIIVGPLTDLRAAVDTGETAGVPVIAWIEEAANGGGDTWEDLDDSMVLRVDLAADGTRAASGGCLPMGFGKVLVLCSKEQATGVDIWYKTAAELSATFPAVLHPDENLDFDQAIETLVNGPADAVMVWGDAPVGEMAIGDRRDVLVVDRRMGEKPPIADASLFGTPKEAVADAAMVMERVDFLAGLQLVDAWGFQGRVVAFNHMRLAWFDCDGHALVACGGTAERMGLGEQLRDVGAWGELRVALIGDRAAEPSKERVGLEVGLLELAQSGDEGLKPASPAVSREAVASYLVEEGLVAEALRILNPGSLQRRILNALQLTGRDAVEEWEAIAEQTGETKWLLNGLLIEVRSGLIPIDVAVERIQRWMEIDPDAFNYARARAIGNEVAIRGGSSELRDSLAGVAP